MPVDLHSPKVGPILYGHSLSVEIHPPMAEAQEYLDEYLSLMDHGSSSQQFRRAPSPFVDIINSQPNDGSHRKDLEALPQGSSFDSRSSPAFRSSLSMQDALYDPYLDDSDSSSMYASPLCRCIDHEPGPICPKDLPDEWSVQVSQTESLHFNGGRLKF